MLSRAVYKLFRASEQHLQNPPVSAAIVGTGLGLIGGIGYTKYAFDSYKIVPRTEKLPDDYYIMAPLGGAIIGGVLIGMWPLAVPMVMLGGAEKLRRVYFDE